MIKLSCIHKVGDIMDETKIYNSAIFKEAMIGNILKETIQILSERGYNPINQIVGYLMSGDPGYISSYKDARKKIMSISRSDILGFLLKEYLGKCDI